MPQDCLSLSSWVLWVGGPLGQDEVQLGEAEEGKVRHGTENMVWRNNLILLNLSLSVERLFLALSPPSLLNLVGAHACESPS